MEWDDEEEATHVLPERDAKEPSHADKPLPAPGPASRAEGKNGPSSRLPSLPGGAPPPPPPTMPGIGFRPLSAPPPNALGGFARASVGATPPPPPPPGMPTGLGSSAMPPPPPGTSTAPMPPVGPVPPTSPYGQAPVPGPNQVHTAPMPMPASRSSGAPAAPQATRAMEQTALVHPAQSRTGLFVGIGLLCLVGVGAVLAIAIPRTGTLRVNATDGKGGTLARVEIFVDGRKVCDTSPCIVENLSPGSHLVKALVGTEGVEKAGEVEARAESTVDIAVSGAAAGATAATTGTGLKVSGTQAGAKLFVDGKEIGALPQDVRDITPGEHKIRIAAGDRYEPLEKTITIAKDETTTLDNVVLKVLKGKATITLGTPGAKVTLVSGSVRKDIPTFPISVDIDTAQNWTLEASKNGFVDFKLPISFSDGQAEKTIHVELETKGSMGSASASTGSASTSHTEHTEHTEHTARTEKPSTTKPVEKTPERTTEKPAGGATAGQASLDINSIPASSVLLDGKPIGNTPRMRVSVGAGNHTVTFVNSEQGLKKSVQVTVTAGESKKVIQRLRD
jgi:serine/threonine-protein kinase